MTYGLNDIRLVPARVSDISHRSECNPYNADDMLPIFTAPMNAVINEHNYETFLNNKINTIIPRGVNVAKRIELSTKTFVAMSMQELSVFIDNHKDSDLTHYICLDIAQGHMRVAIDLCKKAKDILGNKLVLMAGNIANPETYKDYAMTGCDFIRISVGCGSACITTNSTGHGLPMATLIKEVCDMKWDIEQTMISADQLNIECPYKNTPLIIADGGFDSNDKIMKALALGADFVMIGKTFAQCEEACGETVIKHIPQEEKITYQTGEYMDEPYFETVYRTKVLPITHRIYYGMSTERAQKETGRQNITTSEGIEFTVPVNTTISKWTTKFTDNLRSSMSYSNAKTLDEFKNTKYRIIKN